MKKFLPLIYVLLMLSTCVVWADESDMWEYYGDQNAYGQKTVTDEEFQKALESKKRHKKKKIKGEEQHQSNETEWIKESQEEALVLLVPVGITVDKDKVLPIGHYQIIGERKDGKTEIKFYQAHYLMAKFPAKETKDDYNQESLNFVKLIPLNSKQMKLIYGSLDFNAYTVLEVAD